MPKKLKKRKNKKGRKTTPKSYPNSSSAGPASTSVAKVPELLNVAAQFYLGGDYESAEKMYRRVLAQDPRHPYVLHNLGAIYYQTEQMDLALEFVSRAIDTEPKDPNFYSTRGAILLEKLKFHEALSDFKKALELKPDFADALNNMAIVYNRLGCWEESEACCRKAIQIRPDYAEAYSNLGNACRNLSRIPEAADAFKEALQLKPGMNEAQVGLGLIFTEIELKTYEPSVLKELAGCFESDLVNHEELGKITGGQLGFKYSGPQILQFNSESLSQIIDEMSSDQLVLSYLEKTFNGNGTLELILTNIRRVFLFSGFGKDEIAKRRLPFAAALALQCFYNEYVFSESIEEKEHTEELKREIENHVNSDGKVTEKLEHDLLRFGMYAPISDLACAENICSFPMDDWSVFLRPVIERMLIEPLAERRICGEIESVGEIQDSTSRNVQAQYEKNPYPRWRTITPMRKVSMGAMLRAEMPHFTPPPELFEPIQILVAGCGTGRHPIQTASSCKGASVLAVDLSRRSIAYGIRRMQELGVEKIRFMQGDILNLEAICQQFHCIESVGVLHHMEKPVVGWNVLTKLLHSNGVMRIGLYSERARAHIARAREHIQARGLGQTTDHIRKFRQEILENPDGPFGAFLREREFYSLSNCRDLLFHVREHRFTIPEIKEILANLGLRFLGFNAKPRTFRAYKQHFPHDTNMTDLDSWDRFEEMFPDTFSEMYQFWCQKVDE